ncbi:MAG: RNA polymerase sigma-70 factor [Chitinophagaceae bacterium]
MFVLIANGDETAFRIVFDRYTPKLKAFFLKLSKDPVVAKELVQETFLSLWLYRSSLSQIEHASAYIYKIAANKALHYYRQTDLDRKILAELAIQSGKSIDDTSHNVQLKDLRRMVAQAVDQLPAQQQQVFRYSRENGLSAREVAEKMGLSEKTVRNHLTLALKSIQQFLQSTHSMHLPAFLLATLVLK